MVQRLTYRRQNTYNTKSNKVKVVKLPGGKRTFHHVDKKAGKPKCGDCKKPLRGIPALRPHQYAAISRGSRRVSRVYGGSRCHRCVRERIIRAFMLEEHKCVKAVLLEKEKQKAAATKKRQGSKGDAAQKKSKHASVPSSTTR